MPHRFSLVSWLLPPIDLHSRFAGSIAAATAARPLLRFLHLAVQTWVSVVGYFEFFLGGSLDIPTVLRY